MTGSPKLVAGFRPSAPPAWTLVWLLTAALLAVAIRLWQGDGYWDYSDGVYALSARQIVAGDVPYVDFAAAQPPLLFGLGALILWIHDGLGWLRAAMAGVQLVGAGLVVVAVLRLTGRRLPAALAGLAALLTPWALHEHAQLTPETFAAPLLLGSALALSRARTIWLGALLGAAAALCKLAFGLPALVLLLTATARWRALAWGVATGVVALAISLLLFGGYVVDGVLTAQLESGRQTFRAFGGLWLQAGWNLVVLVVPAALAWRWRTRAADRELLRLVAASAVGALALLLSLTKDGSYLNVLVVMELPLLVLAATGATWAFTPSTHDATLDGAAAQTDAPAHAGLDAPTAPASASAIAPTSASPAARRVLIGLGLLWIVQIGALVVSPDDPKGFTRPFSGLAHGRLLSPDELEARTAEARRCAPGVAYGGPPHIAYREHRRLPGNQPDPFILQSPIYLGLRWRADADQPRCEVAP